MSESAEAIDELSDRRRQPDASEVFMYTFAAVGALTLAEMDDADAAVPGAAAHGHSHIPSAPGVSGAPGPHVAPDSAFRAAVSALTAPLGNGSEAPTQSGQVGSDPAALSATDNPPSNASSAPAPMFAESFGSSEAPFGGAPQENPLASLAGDTADVNEPSSLAVYEETPAQLGASDFLQSLGAYQTLSPEVANPSVIAGFSETSTSLAASVRA
jgi:hypothetical protein